MFRPDRTAGYEGYQSDISRISRPYTGYHELSPLVSRIVIQKSRKLVLSVTRKELLKKRGGEVSIDLTAPYVLG